MEFYDNESMFELGSKMKVRVEMIGGDDPHGGGFRGGKYPVVIIDDVYKDPDRISDFVNTLPVPLANCNYEKYYGNRITIDNFIGNENFLNTLAMLLLHKLEMTDMITYDTATNNNQFCVNIIHNDKEHGVTGTQRKESYIPHSDPSLITSILYLNKDDELETNGTGIYRHIKSDLVGYPQDDLQSDWITDCEKKGGAPIDNSTMRMKKEVLENAPVELKYDECVFANNDEWELLWESTGKYNQMVSYMGGMFHSALFDIKELIDIKRLSQVIFWNFEPAQMLPMHDNRPVISPRNVMGETLPQVN
tara:strand:- start:627 stop:1544 length:918 start_codon:yes stop_codon:yes gene_type:complete